MVIWGEEGAAMELIKNQAIFNTPNCEKSLFCYNFLDIVTKCKPNVSYKRHILGVFNRPHNNKI